MTEPTIAARGETFFRVSMSYSHLIQKAMDFAAKAHEGQYRKKGDIPYFSHCAIVGSLLAAAGCDESVVSAGVLHDLVENTDTSVADLEKKFGPAVAALVDAVSEDKAHSTWAERKQGYIESVARGPDGTEAIVAADKIHNMASMLAYQEGGGDLWGISKGSREGQLRFYHAIGDILTRRIDRNAPVGVKNLLVEYKKFLATIEDRPA